MSEEVKRVIEYFEEYVNGYIGCICPWEDDIQALLNYISNLQQENKQLKEVIEEVREYINHCQLGVYANGKPVMLVEEDEGKDLLQILDKAKSKVRGD